MKAELNGLKVNLEEVHMDDLLYEDQEFENEKEQVCCMFLALNLGELDYFKVMVDNCLMKETKLTDD